MASAALGRGRCASVLDAVGGLQYLVPGREFFLSDLAANVVGILVGLVIMALWHRQQAVQELDDRVL